MQRGRETEKEHTHVRTLLNAWSIVTCSLHEAVNRLHQNTAPKFISLILTFLFVVQFPLMAMADHTNEPVIPVSDEDFLYYHHDDHLGSSHVLTEGKDKGYHSGVTYNKGDLLQRFEYEPFGREKYVLNPNLNIDPSYTGQIYDVESGLYYYHARYYDPTLGRFIQPDTLVPDAKNLQEFNRYGYVTNNPLKYTDPTGHFRIGGESFSGGPLGGFGEGFTGGFAGGGSGILQAFGSGLSLVFDMFKQNSWNEEVVADGSGDSQYYYEYEGSEHPGGILGGVVAIPFHFEYGDDESWFGLDTAPSEIELTLVLGIWGYVFAPQLQEMLDSKLWGYAQLPGMFVGGGTAAGGKALGWLGVNKISQSIGKIKIPIYRVYGGGSSMYGKSYSLINPKYIPFYRNFGGLPNLNSGQYLLKGYLPVRDIQIGRWFAAPLDGRIGGLPFELYQNYNQLSNVSNIILKSNF